MTTLLERCDDWTDNDSLTALGVDLSGYTAAQITLAIDAASDWLFVKHRRWAGTSCTQTVRPCGQHLSGCTFGWGVGSPLCRCAGAHILELPHGPIVSVDSVVVAGDTLAEGTGYRVIQPNMLARIDDNWPACNDPAELPNAAVDDAWYVTYTYGEAPPALAQLAAAALAAELLKAQTNAGDCVLPPSTIRASGLGLTLDLDAETVARAMFPVGAFFDAYPPRIAPSVRIPGHRNYFVDTP